ncbi:MAG: hypothetical protein LBV38_01075 [Alistipes sp.]|jgi:hypothetical protein|nr:hypothetical protein [Alistipes sp.]
MKKLGANGMKVLKTCHLLLVMMWVVGVIAMAVLFLLKPESGDELYMTLRIILFVDYVFVMPGALLTILVGIIYGIYTNWGFFKHRWIIVKWIASIAIILVGTFYFSPPLEHACEIADSTRDAALRNPMVTSDMTHAFFIACVESIAIIILVVISVFKPWKKKKQANKNESIKI